MGIQKIMFYGKATLGEVRKKARVGFEDRAALEP
jgi:hypothetical protein